MKRNIKKLWFIGLWAELHIIFVLIMKFPKLETNKFLNDRFCKLGDGIDIILEELGISII